MHQRLSTGGGDMEYSQAAPRLIQARRAGHRAHVGLNPLPVGLNPSFCFVLYMLPFFFLSATNSFPFSLKNVQFGNFPFLLFAFYVLYVIASLTSLWLIYALSLSLLSLISWSFLYCFFLQARGTCPGP